MAGGSRIHAGPQSGDTGDPEKAISPNFSLETLMRDTGEMLRQLSPVSPADEPVAHWQRPRTVSHLGLRRPHPRPCCTPRNRPVLLASPTCPTPPALGDQDAPGWRYAPGNHISYPGGRALQIRRGALLALGPRMSTSGLSPDTHPPGVRSPTIVGGRTTLSLESLHGVPCRQPVHQNGTERASRYEFTYIGDGDAAPTAPRRNTPLRAAHLEPTSGEV